MPNLLESCELWGGIDHCDCGDLCKRVSTLEIQVSGLRLVVGQAPVGDVTQRNSV
jgi:hypothetical protein